MRPTVTARATLAACAAALLVMLVPATPAWAHTRLVSSDPASGATVATPLTAVALTFTEMVKQQVSTVIVTGVDGVSYSDGGPRSVDKTLTQPVKALPTGAITVAYRAVSADGHPVEGRFTFTNAAAAPTSAASTSAPPATTQATAPSSAAPPLAADPKSDTGGSAPLWAVAGGVVVVLLLLGGTFWFRRRAAGTN